MFELMDKLWAALGVLLDAVVNLINALNPFSRGVQRYAEAFEDTGRMVQNRTKMQIQEQQIKLDEQEHQLATKRAALEAKLAAAKQPEPSPEPASEPSEGEPDLTAFEDK